jgi:hypothetical protein
LKEHDKNISETMHLKEDVLFYEIKYKKELNESTLCEFISSLINYVINKFNKYNKEVINGYHYFVRTIIAHYSNDDSFSIKSKLNYNDIMEYLSDFEYLINCIIFNEELDIDILEKNYEL